METPIAPLNALSVTSEHGAGLMMLDTTPSAHLAQSDALPLPVPAITGAAILFTPCSVRDVFLSFPAWNGPGCQQDDAKIALNLAVMSEIRTGDRLIIDRTSHGDHLPWHIYHEGGDGSRQMVGKMQRRFHPGPDIHQLKAVVFAMVEWKKQDSDDRSRLSIHRDRWLTVVPEWAPSVPGRNGSTASDR